MLLRSRSTDLRVTHHIEGRSWDGWNPNTGVFLGGVGVLVYPTWSNFFVGVGRFAEVDDVPTPGFRNISKHGGIVMSYFRRAWSERDSPDQTLTLGPYYDYGKYVMTGPIGACVKGVGGEGHILDGDLIRARQIALINAYSKVYSSPIMSGELLSDLDKTIGMLKRPFSHSRDLLAKMNKYRLKRLGKTSKSAALAASNAWLEYRYGWKPLLIDAHTIIDEVHKKRDRATKRLVARASEMLSSRTSTPYSLTGIAGWPMDAQGSIDTEVTVSVHAGVIYDVVSQSTSSELSRFFGTGSRDLASTAWEIIPYSFVADWFVNVGDWLQAVSPVPGINIRGNWVTSVKRYSSVMNGNLTYTMTNASANHAKVTIQISDSLKGDEVIRLVNQEIAKHPVWTTRSVSTLHAVDALSLMMPSITEGLSKLRH